MKKYLKECRKDLTSERSGFAITFEVMMVSLLLSLVITVLIFFVQTLNTQRFFYNVTAATCTAAARYGGNDSQAYAFQVQQSTGKTGTIEGTANAFLTSVAKIPGSENLYILEPTASGKYITVNSVNDEKFREQNIVTVEMKYKLGNYGIGNLINSWGAVFGDWGNNETTHHIELPSLMQYGKLVAKGT